MHLNIKNDETHELATRLAELTGESLTQAVTHALRDSLERELRRRSSQALAEDLLTIGRRCAAHERRDRRSHGDFLYDEQGLPRK